MRRAIPLLLMTILLGCKCPKKVTNITAVQESDKMELTLLLTDNYGGTEGEELQVFRSEGELKKFFTRVNKTRKPGLAVPEVDFSKQLVLLYCPGTSTNGSWQKLEARQSKDERILIEARESKKQEEVAAGAITMPFSLYTMPLTDKEVVLDQP